MGRYDVPSTINFILDKTGNEQVAYVGFSQGTSQMFYGASVMFSYYREKVSVFVALGPCGAIPNSKTPLIQTAGDNRKTLEYVTHTLSIYELKGPDWLEASSTYYLCNFFPEFCEDLKSFGKLQSPEFDNMARFNVWRYHNFDSGSSVMALLHFAQNLKSGEFETYDRPTGNHW